MRLTKTALVFDRKAFFLCCIHLCTMIITILWAVLGPRGEASVYWLCVYLLVQFGWFFWSWYRTTGRIFDPYSIFLLAAVLFNGGKAILEVFRLNEHGIEKFFSREGYLTFSFSLETMISALLLVSLGLGGLHLGALLAACKSNRYIINVRASSRGYENVMRLVGLTLISVSFLPLLYTIWERVQLVSSAGYFALFQQQAETGFGSAPKILASLMIPGVFHLLVGGSKKRWALVSATSMIALYVVILAFTGTRMWWAMPLVAYVWLWHRRIARLPKSLLLGAAATLLLLVFPVLAMVRNIPGQERFSLTVYVEAYLSVKNPLVSILSEMGGTLMTVAHTVELIPTFRDFDWGLGYAYALLTIFPNMFWEIHPSVAHGLYSHWLTFVINPNTFYAGGGYGFSFIAEAYANFGWAGTPVLLALIGFLFARFVLWASFHGEPDRMAMLASFISFFMIYARGESALVVRPLIWYSFFPYMLVRLYLGRKLRIMAQQAVPKLGS